MAWINSRTRSRRPASIGSNQLSKRSGCVLMIVMAWSPVRRFNAGRFEVEHPGDYATFNSYQPRYGTPTLLIFIQKISKTVPARGQKFGGRWAPRSRDGHPPTLAAVVRE